MELVERRSSRGWSRSTSRTRQRRRPVLHPVVASASSTRAVRQRVRSRPEHLGRRRRAHRARRPAAGRSTPRRAGRCGALKFHGLEPAEIKRMWVAPTARGLGVGRRILNELELHARQRGVRAVRLETNKTLREAMNPGGDLPRSWPRTGPRSTANHRHATADAPLRFAGQPPRRLVETPCQGHAARAASGPDEEASGRFNELAAKPGEKYLYSSNPATPWRGNAERVGKQGRGRSRSISTSSDRSG